MAEISVTVNRTLSGENDEILSAVAYYDGESFFSFVIRESNVADDANESVKLLEQPYHFTDMWRAADGQIFVCDADGQVHKGKGKRWTRAEVSTRPLTAIWGLSQKDVYVGGNDGVVYRFDGQKWSALSPALGQRISCLRGSSPKDIYACGEQGLFWHYDGKKWTAIDLKSKGHLYDLLVLSPEDVLVSGDDGGLWRGAENTWAKAKLAKNNLYSLSHYKGTIYVAAGDRGVFTYDGKKLTNVKDSFPAYRLSASKKYLTVAGANSAIRFDGTDWSGPDYT